MKIFHITSIELIESILSTGTYIPSSANPANGDAGLCCYIADRPTWSAAQAEHDGAVLHFEWSGPMQIVGSDVTPPSELNVLYDQHPWRGFIRNGSSGGYLHATTVELRSQAGASDPETVARVRRVLERGPVAINILPAAPVRQTVTMWSRVRAWIAR